MKTITWLGLALALNIACFLGCLVAVVSLSKSNDDLRSEMAKQRRGAEEIRAKRFVVVDDEGASRMLIGFYKNQSAISLLDSSQKPRIALFVDDKDIPTIMLLDAQEKCRLIMKQEHTTTGISLQDRNEKPVSTWGAIGPWANLKISDSDGKLIWQADDGH